MSTTPAALQSPSRPNFRSPRKGDYTKLTLERQECEAALQQIEQEEVQAWVESVLGEAFEVDHFFASLKDGQVLCRLLNALRPESVPVIRTKETQAMDFLRSYENVVCFIKGCKAFGLADEQIFLWNDVIKAENLRKVVSTLLKLKAKVMETDPTAGAKFPSVSFPRHSLSTDESSSMSASDSDSHSNVTKIFEESKEIQRQLQSKLALQHGLVSELQQPKSPSRLLLRLS